MTRSCGVPPDLAGAARAAAAPVPPDLAAVDGIPRRLAEAMGPVLGARHPSRWSARALADGGQARLFTIVGRDGRPVVAPDGGAEELVVKLYHADAPDHRQAARDEYECLRRLHGRLHGTSEHGWTILCPRPLHWSDSSAALVMTRVPGRTLSWHLSQGQSPPDELDTIARATVACLRRYWAGEPRLYGDLILNNILCDRHCRTLSLLDPGMPEPFYVCDAAPRAWFPASRDLGFLMFWTASLVRRSLAHPVLHVRQKHMAARIVRTFLDGIGLAAERAEAAAEIEACARLHLGRIRTSASPRGLWHGVVRRAATRTIDRMVDGLREPEPADGPRGASC